MIEPLTDAELGQLALDLAGGRVFTDRDVRHAEDVPAVFMPLIFMDRRDLARLTVAMEDGAVLYEYLSRALPTGVDGMPCFASMRVLDPAEADTVRRRVLAIREAAGA